MEILRTVLANRQLARLELVWACAALVRWALAIVIALYAYREAGAGGVGVSALVRMLPAAVLAPRLSLLADRRSRRLVLFWSLSARAGLLLAMTAVVVADGPLGLLLVPAMLYGVADTLQKPTQAALLGVLARTPAQLAAANTLWSVLDNVGFVVGSLLVGALVAVTGLQVGFLALVLPLGIAMVVTALLDPHEPPPPMPAASPRDEIWAGARAVATDGRLRLLVGILVADMFIQAMVDVLLVVAALGLLDMGPQGAGWLSTAWGVGGILGGAATILVLARRHIGSGLLAGLLLAGLPLVAIGWWPHQALAVGLMTVMGVGFGLLEVAMLTLTQRLVAADLLGRVYGVQETLVGAAMAAGSVAASGLVVLVGEAGALMVVGTVLPLLSVATVRGVRGLDDGATAPDGVFEILRSVSAFSFLPMGTVENLARRARSETYEPRHEVVRQGEPGSTFYVIAEGAVEVLEDGRLRRVEREGEYFGEIALLHRVPRTATVRTVERTHLLALDQEGFLAAVGAHPRTSHELSDVVSVRLGTGDGTA